MTPDPSPPVRVYALAPDPSVYAPVDRTVPSGLPAPAPTAVVIHRTLQVLTVDRRICQVIVDVGPMPTPMAGQPGAEEPHPDGTKGGFETVVPHVFVAVLVFQPSLFVAVAVAE